MRRILCLLVCMLTVTAYAAEKMPRAEQTKVLAEVGYGYWQVPDSEHFVGQTWSTLRYEERIANQQLGIFLPARTCLNGHIAFNGMSC